MSQQRGHQAQQQTSKEESRQKEATSGKRSEDPVETVQEWLGTRAASRQWKSTMQQAEESNGAQPTHSLLQSMTSMSPRSQSKPRFRGVSQEWGGALSGLVVQPKLMIGEPNDKYEQEADRVAQQVVQQIQSPPVAQTGAGMEVQRLTEEDEAELQRKSESLLQGESAEGMAASGELEASIRQARGGGVPLPETVREPMERAFGADFSGVRIHANAQADQLNRSISAKAFTTGQDVFVRQGAYQPGSWEGQELLAHELTHVVQQNGNNVERSGLLKPQQPSHTRITSTIQRKFDGTLKGITWKSLQTQLNAKGHIVDNYNADQLRKWFESHSSTFSSIDDVIKAIVKIPAGEFLYKEATGTGDWLEAQVSYPVDQYFPIISSSGGGHVIEFPSNPQTGDPPPTQIWFPNAQPATVTIPGGSFFYKEATGSGDWLEAQHRYRNATTYVIQATIGSGSVINFPKNPQTGTVGVTKIWFPNAQPATVTIPGGSFFYKEATGSGDWLKARNYTAPHTYAIQSSVTGGSVINFPMDPQTGVDVVTKIWYPNTPPATVTIPGGSFFYKEATGSGDWLKARNYTAPHTYAIQSSVTGGSVINFPMDPQTGVDVVTKIWVQPTPAANPVPQPVATNPLPNPEFGKPEHTGSTEWKSGTVGPNSAKSDPTNSIFPEGGPKPDQVLQGELGDCYLMAALASITKTNPNCVKQMITVEKNTDKSIKSVTVNLYKPTVIGSFTVAYQKTPIKVTPEVAKTKDGSDRYAHDYLWVQMIEKAYAAGGFTGDLLKRQGTTTSYANIAGGTEQVAFAVFLGQAATQTNLGNETHEGITKQIELLEDTLPAQMETQIDALETSTAAETARLAIILAQLDQRDQTIKTLKEQIKKLSESQKKIAAILTPVNTKRKTNEITNEEKNKLIKGADKLRKLKSEIEQKNQELTTLEAKEQEHQTQRGEYNKANEANQKLIKELAALTDKRDANTPAKEAEIQAQITKLRDKALTLDAHIGRKPEDTIFNQIKNALNGGKAVAAGTRPFTAAEKSRTGGQAGHSAGEGMLYGIVAPHGYTVQEVKEDGSTKKIVLRNPWGSYGREFNADMTKFVENKQGIVTLTMSQFFTWFNTLTISGKVTSL